MTLLSDIAGVGNIGLAGIPTVILGTTVSAAGGFNGSLGAAVRAAVLATTGNFSGTLGVTGVTTLAALNATTGTFSGNVGIGGAAHASWALALTSVDEHIRMTNGAETNLIRTMVDGSLDFWANGSAATDVINFRTGSGAGTVKATIDNLGAATFSGEINTDSGGIIKTISGDLSLVQGAVGIRINDASLAISPTNATANDDATISLGRPTIRFTDLYLSGGAYLGGTSASNLLDEYYGNSYLATAGPNISGTITLDSARDTLSFVKVGRLVTVTGMIQITSVSSPVGTYVNVNLPYTLATSLPEFSNRGGGAATYNDSSAGTFEVVPIWVAAGAFVRVYIDASTLAASDTLTFSFSYQTDL
jgi:hypothetical protein